MRQNNCPIYHIIINNKLSLPSQPPPLSPGYCSSSSPRAFDPPPLTAPSHPQPLPSAPPAHQTSALPAPAPSANALSASLSEAVPNRSRSGAPSGTAASLVRTSAALPPAPGWDQVWDQIIPAFFISQFHCHILPFFIS